MFNWVVWASKNIETFKMKLRGSKASGLLQRVAFLVFIFDIDCDGWTLQEFLIFLK